MVKNTKLSRIVFQQYADWQLAEKNATPESLWTDYHRNRRQFMKLGAGAIAGVGLSNLLLSKMAHADNSGWQGAAKGLMAGVNNETYKAARRFPITDEHDVTHYNNFYEFGSGKDVFRGTDQLTPYPWTVKVDGMVDNPQTFDILPLIKKMSVETRVYRHRCVEAWSMTVPWVGFPLKKLLKAVGVKSSAKFVAFETAADEKSMPGLQEVWYPWPYQEGLTVAEAMNDLPFLVVGAYGKPLPNQNGAPLRLALPWKYGFKSIKSIVRISLVDKMPKTFWSQIAKDEYGFYANVNPAVPHRRWSQASERVLGDKSGERVPTLKYNGYEKWVADIYKDLPQDRTLFY